jgi:hypothetical protein
MHKAAKLALFLIIANEIRGVIFAGAIVWTWLGHHYQP